MSARHFHCPPRIVYGRGTVDQAGVEAKAFGSTALVVTGKSSAARSGAMDKVLKALNDAHVTPIPFAEVESDPSVETCERGAELARAKGCQVIVALGGGSPMDAAKAMALLLANPGKLTDYENMKPNLPGMPVVAIPTTAGTASEVTRFAVITDTERKLKMLVGGPGIVPKVAILDPLLTVSMPAQVTAATGMDALTHAVEAYISRLATPMTDVHALAAIGLIAGSLIKAVTDPQNLQAREDMLLGQLQAGLAFSNASVALVHSMARPLGAHFGIAHGMANAILLPTVMAYNRPACPERLAQVARAMGEQVDGLTVRDASHVAVEAIATLFEETGLPDRLADLGVTEDALPRLAADALAAGSTAFNPRTPSVQDIEALYRELM